MNSDHVSREAALHGRDLFTDSSNLSHYGDMQFGAANGQYDASLWPSDHGPDELSFATKDQPHALQQGWNNTIPASVTPAASGYSQSRPYAHQTSSTYPGHNFAFNGPIGFNEHQLDPGLATGNASNAYHLGAGQYGPPGTHSSTISPQALQHSNITDFTKDDPRRSNAKNVDGPKPVIPYASNDGAVLDKVPLKAPRGSVSGPFVITDYNTLAEATKSYRLHNFVNVGTTQIDPGCNLKTSLPNYVRRQSRNEFRRRVGDDKALLAKAGQKPSKLKSLSQRPAYQRSTVSKTDQAGRIKQETVQSPTESESSSEESDSEYSDSDLEISEPPPLPDKRPDKPIDAVRYDTIKAVWATPGRPADSEEIRNSLKSFWEVVRTIRDRWKSDGNALKQAEEAKKKSELPLLKDRVNSQRDMMQSSIDAALEFGHRDVLAFFGENTSFLFLSYQFLLDRFAEKDFDGPLSQGFLELLAKCTTITNEALEKTHLVKVLPRFEKRGNEKTAALAKKVIAEAEKVSKTKGETTTKDKAPKDATKETVKAEPAGSPKSKAEPVIGIKRQREGPATVGQPAKKINSGSPLASVLSKAATKRTSSGSSADIKTASTTTVAPKAKGQQVQAKPSSFFSSLQSAAKRPGTSKASTVSVLDKDRSTSEKKTAPTAPIAASKPVWSFAETMANLNKAKEPEPTAKPKPDSPPETPEEKAKRLRKEERRKLRVSFKPEASLVEIRVFERQDEELADRDNNVRDVDDKGGEGRMFKQHIDAVEMDDDDDYSPEYDVVSLIEFREPSYIDFSTIEKGERERNYAPYGGGELKADSPESKVQEEHERNTLMAIYGDRSDIPACPREPSDPYTGEVSMTASFGAPPQQVMQRAEAAKNNAAARQQSAQVAPDVSALLKVLGGVQPQQQPQLPPLQQKQDVGAPSSSSLESIFAKFANPGQQTQPQQAPMQAPIQPQQSAVNPQLQALLATMQGQAPAQQPIQQGQQQAQPNLAALLHQLQLPTSQGLAQGFGMSAQQGTPPQRSLPFEDPERKRWREEQEANQGNLGNQNNQGSNNKKRKFVDKKFTQPCRYYREGKCLKGAQCTYVHE